MGFEIPSRIILAQRLEEIEASLNYLKMMDGSKTDELMAFNVSKANVTLMLYNLIESTVYTSMDELYSKITECTDYIKDNESILSNWIESSMHSSFGRTKSFDDYVASFKKLLIRYKNNDIVLTYSHHNNGNIDFDTIMRICNNNGIDIDVSALNCKSCKQSINDIKQIRNILSHGEQSFQEKGRDLTIDDLVRYKTDTVALLECFIDSVEKHIMAVAS